MSKDIKYIDVHGHVNFANYGNDCEDVIKRANDNGVAIITVGADMETSRQAVELAKKHENMWAVVGVHPEYANSGIIDELRKRQSSNVEEITDLELLAQDPKVVAIGECGLDYFHAKPDDYEKQRELFEMQIDIANKVNKPLMLHVRNGKKPSLGYVGEVKGNGDVTRSAYLEVVEILRRKAKVKVNFHFFAGNMEDLKAILDIGGSISFTGVLTFTHDYDEAVKYVPLTSIMSETDCPFVSPVPHRGKRNEPAFVVEVVKAIARIRGEEEDAVRGQLLENAKNFFGI